MLVRVRGEFSMEVEESGEGSSCLVVVGVADETGKALADRLPNVRVVRYDPRGTGGTPSRPPETSAQHAADLASLVKVLKIMKPVVLASGERAPIAVGYAVRNLRELKRLVLVAPVLAPADETKLGRVGEKAVVMREPDLDRLCEVL